MLIIIISVVHKFIQVLKKKLIFNYMPLRALAAKYRVV